MALRQRGAKFSPMAKLKRRDRLAWLLRQRGYTYPAIAERLARFQGRPRTSSQRASEIVKRYDRVMRRRARDPRWYDGLRPQTVTMLKRAGYDTPEAIRAGLRDGSIRPESMPNLGPRSYADLCRVFGAPKLE
ncbi:hypothetical protein SAOR_00915 [Salinisphaera orenii MK-B5]|uniref:Uncharacterized protein n=1 Tax=Salinisphaera orenii MK-B5 TaxID=856730 RepID=A0A423PYC0_9GAMM|nr:hypothetical protein SAOR_00915 [Salinisphaera orenii MK-B5]